MGRNLDHVGASNVESRESFAFNPQLQRAAGTKHMQIYGARATDAESLPIWSTYARGCFVLKKSLLCVSQDIHGVKIEPTRSAVCGSDYGKDPGGSRS